MAEREQGRSIKARAIVAAGILALMFAVAGAPGTWAQAPAEPARPQEEEWNPLRAMKSIEVGIYYMKKGVYDAAIDRFEEAARLHPRLARPHQLLGEVYEKQGEPARAIAAYRKYLELYRRAPNREEILGRIERLEKEQASQDDGAKGSS